MRFTHTNKNQTTKNKTNQQTSANNKSKQIIHSTIINSKPTHQYAKLINKIAIINNKQHKAIERKHTNIQQETKHPNPIE